MSSDEAAAEEAILFQLRNEERKRQKAARQGGESTTTTTTTTTTTPVTTVPPRSTKSTTRTERTKQRPLPSADDDRQKKEEEVMNAIESAWLYYGASDTKRKTIRGSSIYRADYSPLYRLVKQEGGQSSWWLTGHVIEYGLKGPVEQHHSTCDYVSTEVAQLYGDPDLLRDVKPGEQVAFPATSTLLVPIMSYDTETGRTNNHYTLLVVKEKIAYYFETLPKTNAEIRDSSAYATAKRMVQALNAQKLTLHDKPPLIVDSVQRQEEKWECGYFVLIIAGFAANQSAVKSDPREWPADGLNDLLTSKMATSMARKFAYDIAVNGTESDIGSRKEYIALQDRTRDELLQLVLELQEEQVKLLTQSQHKSGAATNEEVRELKARISQRERELLELTADYEATRDAAETLASAKLARQEQRYEMLLARTNMTKERLLNQIDELKSDITVNGNLSELDLKKYGREAEQMTAGEAVVQSGDMGTLVTQRAIESSLQASATRGSHSMTIRIDENESVASAAQEITVPHVKMAKDRQSQTKVYAVNFDDKTQRSTINTSPLRNETIYASGRMHVTVNDSANQPVKEASFTYDINAQDAQGNYVLRSANGLRLYLNNLGQGTFRLKMIALEA